MKNINKWDSLSIKDKADLMKLYIKNGINSLEEIRSHYNKFADGGDTTLEKIDRFVEQHPIETYKHGGKINKFVIGGNKRKKGASSEGVDATYDVMSPERLRPEHEMYVKNPLEGFDAQAITDALYNYYDKQDMEFYNYIKQGSKFADERLKFIQGLPNTKEDAYAQAGFGHSVFPRGRGDAPSNIKWLTNRFKARPELSNKEFQDEAFDMLNKASVHTEDELHTIASAFYNKNKKFLPWLSMEGMEDAFHKYVLQGTGYDKQTLEKVFNGDIDEFLKGVKDYYRHDANYGALYPKYLNIELSPPPSVKSILSNQVHSTKTHENAHTYGYLFTPQIARVLKNNRYQFKDDERSKYLDNYSEIYSRLSQLRDELKLDPSKKYTPEDIPELQKRALLEQGTNYGIFGRYSNDIVLGLLNDVFAYGGKLNKFEDGGEKNTLGIPFMSLNSNDYDYYNANTNNMPTKKGEHWTSRNPETGRILKGSNHPTLDVALNMEGILGNKVYKNIDGTYSSYEENQFPTALGVQINNYEYDVSPLDPNKRFKDIKTTKGRKYNEANITYISDKLNNTLLSDIQKNAILGSIIEESGGNPFAVDETGKFKGLLQWEDSRYSPDNSLSEREEIDNQLNYLIETLYNIEDRKSWTHGGKGSGYKSGKHARDSFLNANDLYEAVHALNRGYIRPTGGDYSVKNRYNVAKQIK